MNSRTGKIEVVDDMEESYTVCHGDTLYFISNELKLRLSDIYELNWFDQGGNVKVGMILNLTKGNMAYFDVDVALAAGASKDAIIESLSSYYDVSIARICELNNVNSLEELSGRLLLIDDIEAKKIKREKEDDEGMKSLGGLRYKVSVGDTLRSIARKKSIDIGELAELNLLKESDDVRAGLILNFELLDNVYFDFNALPVARISEYLDYFSKKYSVEKSDIASMNDVESLSDLSGIVKLCDNYKSLYLMKKKSENTKVADVNGVRPVINNEGERLYCIVPFANMSMAGSNVDICCGSWINYPKAGAMVDESVMGIWNGDKYKEFRKSIIDGSYRYCKENTCPSFNSKSGVLRTYDQLSDKVKLAVQSEDGSVAHGPLEINAGFDPSCNLACPSCRNEVIVDKGRKDEILSIIKKIEDECESLVSIVLSGDGDPFGSPYLKNWLFNFDLKKFPNLEKIKMHTNALQLTKKNWEKIPLDVREIISGVEISIDGASSSTYEVNRRGGQFSKLLERLSYISYLRDTNQITYLKFSFVTQANNFKEIPEFIEMGYKYSADTVFFGTIENWGTFTDSEYRACAVHLNGHPEHSKFLDIVASRKFSDPIVSSTFESLKPTPVKLVG